MTEQATTTPEIQDGDPSIAAAADVYRTLASEMIAFAVKLAGGDYHLSYALLNSATERLRSRNHVIFTTVMFSEIDREKDAGKEPRP